MPSHAHIPGCARLNVMRLNAARLNYYEPVALAIIGGVDRSRFVRIEGASVTHVLNDAPDVASVRVHGFTPVAGQRFDLYQGDRSLATQLFGGRILETTALYESVKQNVAYDLQMIDPTWLLNRRRILWTYLGASATTIVLNLMTQAPGITTTHVAAGLPIIDAITFTNETLAACLTAICERVGAYWYLDYSGDLHVYLSETPDAHPITDADPRGSRDHTLSEDLSQVVTRILALGGGGSAVVDAPTSATELPVSDPVWYSEGGGLVEIAGAQRAVYTGIKGRSGTGALVGVGIAPTSAPTVGPIGSLNLGAPLAAGVYKYAITFANATGETTPGPTASVTLGATAPVLAQTSVRPGYYADYQGKTTGGRYSWRIALYYTGGGYALGPPTDTITVNDREYEIFVGYPARDLVTGHLYYPGLTASGPGEITQAQIYRTVDGGSVWYLEQIKMGVQYAGGGWLNIGRGIPDVDLPAQGSYPAGPFAVFSNARISGLQTLPTGFTTRKLYRTAVGGAQLKLHSTNPADPINDVIADATLGANAPASDTSGVVVGANQTVPAGSTSLPVTDAAPFTADGGASGGWANVGNLAIKYAGITGAALTGIPAAGIGAITSAIRHGAAVLVQPRLVGVTLPAAVKAGDAVRIRFELDDPAAQAALGARLGGTAADGIVEEPFTDSNMTLAELTNYAKALLTDRKDPRRTLRFVTRDETVDVGRLITIAMASPPISGTFRIQRVSFSEIAITGGLARVQPLRTVEASNKLYTFADLLRRLRGREGGAV